MSGANGGHACPEDTTKLVDGTTAEWRGEAGGRRSHQAGDLETLARLAAEFAAGEIDDPAASSGRRANDTVVWYEGRGAVAILDDQTRLDTVSCQLLLSYQMQTLRVLDQPGGRFSALKTWQALRVLVSALYGCDAEAIVAHVREGRDDTAGQIVGFRVSAPYWAAYAERFALTIVVERLSGDVCGYLIAPAGGEMDRVDRLATQWVARKLRESLDFHGGGRVGLLHGRP